ncbi:hypothetical protein ACQKWADRAFT_157655 [Trichoderma austrokoningii]
MTVPKPHATGNHRIMFAVWALTVMLAQGGPLFVPASAGYKQLRYVYTIFKIDFTEKRKEADRLKASCVIRVRHRTRQQAFNAGSNRRFTIFPTFRINE